MSILDFMEMTVSGSLFSCLIAIFICLSFAGIGEFFLKGRHGIILHSVVGVTFVAALVTFFAGFCAALCKYIIYVSIFVGACLTLKSIFQKKRTISDFYALVPIFIFMGFILYQLFALTTVNDGIYHYNSHHPHFAGFAIELFKAEYFSRIRIFDAYPYEWSKYHFFHGSANAIPLVAFVQKNFISYLISKFVWMAFLGGAIFDCLQEKYDLKKSVLTFLLGFGLFFMYDRFLWCVYIQSFSPILFSVLLWFMFDFGATIAGRGQLLFSLALALSKGSSTLTGGCLFLLSLYNVLKTEKFQFIQFLKTKYNEKYSFSFIVSLKQKYFSWHQFFKQYKFEVIAIFVFGLAILSMVFVGERPTGENTKIGVSTLSEFTDHFLNFSWLQNFSLLTSFIQYLSLKDLTLSFSKQLIFIQCLFLCMIVYLLVRNRMNCFKLFKNHKIFWSCLGISCVGLFFAFNSVMKNSAYVLAMIFLVYLIPFVTLLASIKKNLTTPLIVGILSVLATNFLVGPLMSAPNYSIINYWLLMTFIEQFTQDIFVNKKNFQIIFYGLLIFGLYQFTFRTYWQRVFFIHPKDFYHVSIKLQHIPNLGNQPFEVSSTNQLMMARMHAIKGNRVHYRFIPANIRLNAVIPKNDGKKPLSNVTMSFDFLPQGYEKLGYEKIKY